MSRTPQPSVAFIRAHTRVAAVSYVPEVRLYQADDVYALWQATESETRAADVLPPPFWAFPWAGGQALARYLLDHPEVAAGKRVFDLAAGSGVAGIAAALAGAAGVTANEIDEHALAAIGMNAALNRVSVDLAPGDLLEDEVHADLVLAGDAFYRRPMADRVLRFLTRACAGGAAGLVGDPGRAYLPRERLVWLTGYDVPVAADLEDADVKRVDVWRLPDPALWMA